MQFLSWPVHNSISFEFLCLVTMCGHHKNRAACQGDSGGPFTLIDGNKRVLIGVTSYGSPRCLSLGQVQYFTCIRSSNLKFQKINFYFSTATVFARVTRIMPWLLSRIQTGECGYIKDRIRDGQYAEYSQFIKHVKLQYGKK